MFDLGFALTYSCLKRQHSNLFTVANLPLVINSVDKPNIHVWLTLFKDQSQLKNKEKELKKLSDLLVKLEEKGQEDSEAVKGAQDHFHAVSAGLSSNEGGEDKTLADQIMSKL